MYVVFIFTKLRKFVYQKLTSTISFFFYEMFGTKLLLHETRLNSGRVNFRDFVVFLFVVVAIRAHARF